MKKILTLGLIYDQEKILLGYKKIGFGQGRWNGFGGKVEAHETTQEAAIREIQEEAGITPLDIKHRGILMFEFEGEEEVLEVHIFSAHDFKGELVESNEMKPEWFKLDQIPFNKMWPDDQYWLPFLLAGKNFSGTFLFKDQKEIINHEISEI